MLNQYEGAFVSAQIYHMLSQTYKTPNINGRLFYIRWIIQETCKLTFNVRADISYRFGVEYLRYHLLNQVVVDKIDISQGKTVQVPSGFQQLPIK